MRRSSLLLAGCIAALALVGCAGGDDEAATTKPPSGDWPPSWETAPTAWVITDLGPARGGETVGAVKLPPGGRLRLPLSLTSRWVGRILPCLPGGGRKCYALDANSVGQVVGWSAASTTWRPPRAAVLWQNGHVRRLGTLGGWTSEATAINDHGQVVGRGVNSRGVLRAFLWQSGRMRELESLSGDGSDTAVALDNQGQIVGWEENYLGVRAVLWEKNRAIDLGTLGGKRSIATDINERGEIIGLSTLNGVSHKVRWTLKR